MNQSATHRLRAIYLADLQFAPNDPRNITVWRRLKRAYLKVPKPDRHPSRLGAALNRAMDALTPST